MVETCDARTPAPNDLTEREMKAVISLAAELRHFQIIYFRTKSKILLQRCKDLENKFDKILANRNLTFKPTAQPVQQKFYE